MSIFQSVVLGIVQGLGEFLPISSSAHLIIVPWVLGWDDGGLTFDVALHAGTLVALVIYFFKDWVNLVRSVLRIKPSDVLSPQKIQDSEARLALYIVYATIPGAIMGVLLEKKAEHAFRNPALIAINLAVMGVVLWIADARGRKVKNLNQISLKESLLIGLAQGFAVIPGFSRSGVTISTGLAEGFARKEAARFSFLLSMPIIAGACILKLRHLTGQDLTVVFCAGILAAAISGYLAIGLLMKLLERGSYKGFAVYRIVIGIAVLVLVYMRGGGSAAP